jgi:hypothetical protein
LNLFVGGMALAYWRATRAVLYTRVGLVLATSVLLFGLPGVAPIITYGIALAGVLMIVLIEQREIQLHGNVD